MANIKAVAALVRGRAGLNHSLRVNQDLRLFKRSFQAAFGSEAAAPLKALAGGTGGWGCLSLPALLKGCTKGLLDLLFEQQ